MRPARLVVLIVSLFAAATTAAQAPRPFPTPPRPGGAGSAPPPQPAQPQPNPPRSGGAPTETALGVPIHPSAQFLTSYDAGLGQRYYIFGAQASFNEVVAYYKTLLKEKGELVFEQPATHMFEVGRFRPETMAFPPSVTIKDFTWDGSEGYLNPKPNATPKRFPAVIQIVPAPPGVSR